VAQEPAWCSAPPANPQQKSKSTGDLAANDIALAQWASDKNMNISHVRQDNLTHMRQGKMMDAIILALLTRGFWGLQVKSDSVQADILLALQ
jgi:hypothetical protein